MAEVIRYGIIGTGMMGCEHIRNIMEIDDTKVVAISDPDEKSRGWGILSCGEDPDLGVHQDHREMLERAPIDAVVVAWDGLLAVAVGAAAHRSIDERRPVTLEELGVG